MINIIGLDAEELLREVLGAMEDELGEPLLPGDERRMVAETILSALIAAANTANAYANGQLVRYSSGRMLDLLGDFVSAQRLPAAPASTVLSFTVDAPAGQAVTIPAGTRATHDGKIYWATTGTVTAAAGAQSVTAAAEATEPGADYNGIAAGRINVIVDPIPYVSAVSNQTVTAGGVDEEDDDAFRERIRTAPSSFSVAGPAGAYRYFAMSAAPGIGDVEVSRPSAGKVSVVILMEDGSLPGEGVLAAVEAALSADLIRPLTDQVLVSAPQEVSYTVTASYTIPAQDAQREQSVKTEVEAAYADYLAWQSARLGRAINPDELRRRLLNAGACRVTLTSPAYTPVGAGRVARAAAGSGLTYGGIQDDDA